MKLGKDRKFLVLQGGGALGAYQAGAYEALHKAGIRPEWIAGISIGAINSAIIAGSPEEKRIENLRAFWDMVSDGPKSLMIDAPDLARKWLNEYSANYNTFAGVQGFYLPRTLMPWQYFIDSNARISYYDTAPLIDTLNRLIDFDLINHRAVRLSLGAVEVASGNFDYFDNFPSSKHRKPTHITAHHVAASGALPPGFPPVQIEDKFYWDGGLVSNTPFQWVLDERKTTDDICVFQVDLFSAEGRMPEDMSDVLARDKEIRYSSRTRLNTDEAKTKQKYKKALARVLSFVPEEFRNDKAFLFLNHPEDLGAVTAVHLIYRRKKYETHSMDNEFSRLTMEEHWKAGYDDVVDTLNSPQWQSRVIPDEGFVQIDHRRETARS